MSQNLNSAVAVIGIDIGKNSFHVVGLDDRGAIVLRQKWSRGQIEARLANMPPCLIGMEACVGAHHLSRKLKALGHDARLDAGKVLRPYSKGQKNNARMRLGSHLYGRATRSRGCAVFAVGSGARQHDDQC
jgi:transposase